MEEAAAPKTWKAKCAWLQEQLDAKETELLSCKRKNDELYKALEDKSDEIHLLDKDLKNMGDELTWVSAELDKTKRELAESRAWAEITFDEHEATRKNLHKLLTNFELERS